MKSLLVGALLSIAWSVIPTVSIYAKTIFKVLYINTGEFVSVKDSVFPAMAYNESELFTQNCSLLRCSVNDKLVITIKNNDNKPHSFVIKNMPNNLNDIQPGETKIDTLRFTQDGVFIYYDNINYPTNKYLGLSGIISVSSSNNSKNFYWNLKEHQIAYNRNLTKNTAVDWKKYDPEFFTINGNSFPNIMDDTLAAIYGRVGDTIRVNIANTGQSSHSLHFHGFHLKILYSSKDASHHGWIKDSFPIKSMETMLLLLVPDKVGEYSIHDHNLIAMSGAQHHPFGMVMIMKIE